MYRSPPVHPAAAAWAAAVNIHADLLNFRVVPPIGLPPNVLHPPPGHIAPGESVYGTFPKGSCSSATPPFLS